MCAFPSWTTFHVGGAGVIKSFLFTKLNPYHSGEIYKRMYVPIKCLMYGQECSDMLDAAVMLIYRTHH